MPLDNDIAQLLSKYTTKGGMKGKNRTIKGGMNSSEMKSNNGGTQKGCDALYLTGKLKGIGSGIYKPSSLFNPSVILSIECSYKK